ncbi:Protein kinase superfamily protein [Euphorbia peplus]|nr:Protein kinase superfamily protein [Euphorbia peplus]
MARIIEDPSLNIINWKFPANTRALREHPDKRHRRARRRQRKLIFQKLCSRLANVCSKFVNLFKNSAEDNQDEFKRFGYVELAHVAGCFFNIHCIGYGGFASVFKGQFRNRTVAVKKLHLVFDSMQDEAEFEAVVRVLRSVDHQNLVKLVGFCSEGRDRVLVSEYVPNQSLYFHLHSNIYTTIDWFTRIKIAIGSAEALTYLHETCQPKIIHKSITAGNILLDNDFNPKVSDFGYAMFHVGTDSMTHIANLLQTPYAHPRPVYLEQGTQIYADPEKQVSEKSDAYSYGVVLLELISGRLPFLRKFSIVDWAKPLIREALGNEKNMKQLIDPKLRNEEETQHRISEIQVMICCAAACVYKPSENRPQMKEVVEALTMKIPLNEIWDMNKDFVFLEP